MSREVMATTTRKDEPGVRVARVALVVGSVMCLALTPPFAMAYYWAYGYSNGESPPGWLAGADWPTWISGPDWISTYKRHGVVFGLALFAVVAALAKFVAPHKVKSRRQRRAWWLIIGGLGAVATGSVLEYGIPEDVFDPSNGTDSHSNFSGSSSLRLAPSSSDSHSAGNRTPADSAQPPWPWPGPSELLAAPPSYCISPADRRPSCCWSPWPSACQADPGSTTHDGTSRGPGSRGARPAGLSIPKEYRRATDRSWPA